jgi:phosphatidylserine/phosphatidylglycerophosphate/cardiolipin synthase-like enzyme
MKRLFIFGLIVFQSTQLQAVSLKDYSPYHYEVLFTNPECELYEYGETMLANNGTSLSAKPKNVYCKTSDFESSAKRNSSPHNRLTQYIEDPTTKEIFMAYLSFSNESIRDSLCLALKRGVKIDLVLDFNPKTGKTNPNAEKLKACGDIKVHYRGNQNGLGFAHNKIFMVNPHHNNEVKIVFSSANMSAGTALHHENWNFITTNPKSYFAQIHLCIKDGMIDHGESRKSFTEFISQCRSGISVAEEDDIKTFVVPGEGDLAFKAIENLAQQSIQLDTAAHRFSGIFIDLFNRLLDQNLPIRLITDDDMYWSNKLRRSVGPNTFQEASRVYGLVERGVEIKLMETNHKEFLLHHNKFMIFKGEHFEAVFAGAGNFSTTAFDKNFENFYIITIPKVVKFFKDQYDLMWNQMATSEELMPVRDIRL